MANGNPVFCMAFILWAAAIILLGVSTQPAAANFVIGNFGLSVGLSVCCTSTGNCDTTTTAPLASQPAKLTCLTTTLTETVVATNTTDSNGGLTFTVGAGSFVNVLPFIIPFGLPCCITIPLPANPCAQLNSTGVLKTLLNSFGTIPLNLIPGVSNVNANALPLLWFPF